MDPKLAVIKRYTVLYEANLR